MMVSLMKLILKAYDIMNNNDSEYKNKNQEIISN
jgi:hypothetical protein